MSLVFLVGSGKIIVNARLAPKIVEKCVASSRLFGRIVQRALNVLEVFAVVCRCVLNEFPPALWVREPGLAEPFKILVFGLDGYDGSIEEAVDCVSRSSNGCNPCINLSSNRHDG